jgi:hypothetical protein
MKRWITLSLAVLGLLGWFAPAWANEEMHPAGRLFYPLWDVSTSNRFTFIIVTRLNLNDNNGIRKISTSDPRWTNSNAYDDCRPRGAGSTDNSGNGNTSDYNRSDQGGGTNSPVFVDDVHVEYYGKSCITGDETIHMSCADIDLLFLGSSGPRKGFALVASELKGAVDVHLVLNGGVANRRKLENSLMGHAVISDIAEGWAATYPAAAAKATYCANDDLCRDVDGGTNVGYESFPQEVYLPFALADGFANAGTFTNFLSLWAPPFMPAGLAGPVNLDCRWWDGRERPFNCSGSNHAVMLTLNTMSSTQFNVANFVCGHTTNGQIAENDGFPRTGSSAIACGGPDVADPTHTSDNAEGPGISLQSSTPLGWWRFNRIPQGPSPNSNASQSVFDGKGLVGVVLTSAAPGGGGLGIGDATRLWHKDPCEQGTHGSLQSFGPMHLRDRGQSATDIVFFNTRNASNQANLCDLVTDVFPPIVPPFH